MKYIVIVPDGMADYPIEELGQKTPLEAAHRTNMDYLAQNGCVGLIKTIPDSQKPGSEIGNLSLLGYNPDVCFTGRAPLEAANLGIDLADDEIAFRCNLVTIVDGKMGDYSAGHIPTAEAAILINAVNEQMGENDVRFYAGQSYRHLMVMKVRKVEDFVKIKCVPPHDIIGQEIKRHLPQGVPAQVLLKLMEKSAKILADHPVNKVRVDLRENPANRIWLWGQGTRPRLPLFKDKFGVEGAIISAVDLVNGIGRLAGLEVISVPGITGYYDTNYLGKAEYALKALKTKDFVFIHIEGPDEAGHNGDYKAKIHCIEHIDREIVGTILNHFDKNSDVRIIVLPDHPTPVKLRTHARDPVGFVMYGKGIDADGSTVYTETSAKEKGIKFKSGEEMMEFFMRRHL
jgi:2,3-bisphosphoglycerate-independent phosphoglycerate mutase